MEIKQKGFIEDRSLLVICPTRGRVHKCKEMLKSFLLKSNKSDSGILFLVDDNDPELNKYLTLFHDYSVAYTVNPRKTYIELMNQASQILPDYKYYCPANDDFIFETNGWDMALMGIIEDQFKGVGIVYCDDGLQKEKVPVVAVISGEIIRSLGWVFPPALGHLFGDNALQVIGRALNRICYASNIVVRHNHLLANKDFEDEISKETNSNERYQKDGIAFKQWEKYNAKDNVIRVAKAILPAIVPTVTLCMIVKDTEKPKDLKRCLDSVADWIDEIRVFVNYKGVPRPWAFKGLEMAVKGFKTPSAVWYGKFSDFSAARNESIKDVHGNFILWLDCDDVMNSPWLIKDWIIRCPEAHGFRCQINCYQDGMTKEIIHHTRIFANNPKYTFRNSAHEDVGFSMKEAGATIQDTNITVYHLGYMDKDTVAQKNERNMALLMKDYRAGNGHSLTYYGIVNCHLLRRTKDDYRKAIRWCDEYFEKFGEDKNDPLTPKMWCLRGGAAFDYWLNTNDPASFMGAKQCFEKAWNGWKFPEGAVNLAECYIREKKFDQALDVLTTFLNEKDIKVGKGLAIDFETIKLSMNEKLGMCYLERREWDNAIVFYTEAMRLKPQLLFGDKIAFALRSKGDWDKACLLTINMVNKWPEYADGFNNLGSYELQCGRYITAALFIRQCLRINPKHPEAQNNLKQLERIK